MTSTRDLLGRRALRRRWSAGRVVLLVGGILAALLGAAAALALWLLPPVLAETPRERFTTATPVELHCPDGSATVIADPGWLAIGIGPFLPEHSAVLLSPDDAYRAELTLLPGPAATTAPAADAAAADPSVTAAPPAAGATPSPAEAAAPDESAAPAPVAAERDLAELLAAHDLTLADLDAAGWHEESLTSGVTVRYAMRPDADGDTDLTVALATQTAAPPAAPAVPVTLVLLATTPAGQADRYRTVTAALLASATFAEASTPSPSPAAAPPAGTGSAADTAHAAGAADTGGAGSLGSAGGAGDRIAAFRASGAASDRSPRLDGGRA